MADICFPFFRGKLWNPVSSEAAHSYMYVQKLFNSMKREFISHCNCICEGVFEL